MFKGGLFSVSHLAIAHFKLDFLLLRSDGFDSGHKSIGDDRDAEKEEEHDEEIDDGAKDLLTHVVAKVLRFPSRDHKAFLTSGELRRKRDRESMRE